MHEPGFLLFASDATLLGIVGFTLILLSLATWLGERRRHRRKMIDAVGCMPWTTLSVLTAFGGTLLLAIAAMGWIAG